MTNKHAKTTRPGRIKREPTEGAAARSNPTKAKAPAGTNCQGFQVKPLNQRNFKMNTTSLTSPMEGVVRWIPALLVNDAGLDDAATKSEALPGAFATAQEAMAVAVAMLGIRPDAIAASARRMLQQGA